MMIRTTLCALALAGVLFSQTFIQMSDPQFGMYAKDAGFEHETANFDFAIATANRLRPAFVVITGDLVNKREDDAEVAEFRRIAAKLDPRIRLFNVPGNHDLGNEPTPESLAAYRKRFGPDYYTFRVGDIAGFVVDSSLLKAAAKVPEEAAKMDAWLRTELAKAKSEDKQIIVFEHIPPFMKYPDEPETYDSFPLETRARYLSLLHEYGVKHLFAGHYHATTETHDGDLEIHITGPVGMPLRGGKSGMRIVSVKPGLVSHQYYDFGCLPESLAPPSVVASH
jgi:DNA repair exonuclease SbcCD nuclease subunit